MRKFKNLPILLHASPLKVFTPIRLCRGNIPHRPMPYTITNAFGHWHETGSSKNLIN